MYGENQNFQNGFDNSADYYGAAPEINPAAGQGGKKKKEKRKSHPFLKKSCSVLASGVAFGLAASLVFVGVVKASGVDRLVSAVSDRLEEPGKESGKGAPLDGAKTDQESSGTGTRDSEGIAKSGIPLANMSQYSDNASIAEIAKAAKPSVVSITNTSVEELVSMFGKREYESKNVGSGIIIGQNETELLIVTNNHVVSGSTQLAVCFGDDENKVAAARIKGTDAGNDLAIISVDLEGLSDEIKGYINIARLGDSDDVEVGDQVVAIGNALGYGQSVTTGIVSAKDREVTIDNVTASLIQTDAAINPGNSGGALLNMKGEVIGINSSKFASTTVEGMGYAIPISTAQPILEELMARQTRDMVAAEEQGFLGISCQNVSSDISEMYHIPKGVYVLGAEAGSAGEKAGLQKGDIITAFDGISVGDYNGLKNTLQYYKAGETVEITIQRADENGGYKERKLSVTLDRNENTDAASQQEAQSNGRGRSYGDSNSIFGDLFNYYY